VVPSAHGSTVRLLSSRGDVEVRNGQRTYAARGRAELDAGDSVTTLPGGAAGLLVGQSMVYLEADSRASIFETSAGPVVNLTRGAARVVVTPRAQLRLNMPDLAAELEPGIYQVAVDPRQSHLHTVAGAAVVAASPAAAKQPLVQTAFQPAEPLPEAPQVVRPGSSVAVPPAPAENGQRGSDLAVETEEQKRRRKQLEDQAAEQAQEQNLAQQDADPQDDQFPDQDEPPSSRGTGTQTATPGPGSQNNIATGGIASSFGGLAASFNPSAGGAFADAGQFTNEGQIVANPPSGLSLGDPFPGNIHLMTAESRYAIGGVELLPSEVDAIFPTGDPVYFSVGTGALPTSQVFTDFLTASDPTPTAFAVPGFDAYVVKFTQFGMVDAGIDPAGAEQSTIGITGLVGDPPAAPTIIGATPTVDERAVLNDLATFALGEFRLRTDGGDSGDAFELAVRRSDQDRLIVKDPGGNDANDQVTPLPGVEYNDVSDPRFQPAAPTVKVADPTTFDPAGQTNYARLNDLRRAAATTIMANQLHEFAQRTGQTRFVVDGKIVDISGYKK